MEDEAFAYAVKETRRIVDKLNSEENLVLSETVQDDEETLQTEREYLFWVHSISLELFSRFVFRYKSKIS